MRAILIPPPVYGLACAVCMVVLSRKFPLVELSAWLPESSRFVLGLLGLSLLVTGIAIDLAAVANFIKRKTTVNPYTPHKSRQLVTSGLYRITRNPMYLGMLLSLTGVALYLGSLSGFVMLPIFIILMNEFQIKAEERVLAVLFGSEYREYCARVRRWI